MNVNIESIFKEITQIIGHNQVIMTIVVILIAVIISVFSQKFVYNIVVFFSSDKNRSKTNKLLRSYCNMIAAVLKYLICIGAFFVILSLYNVRMTVILTSAGFIGVLITYIFQDLIKDVTNGFFIVFSAPFEIGDTIQVDNFVGKVREMNSRYIVLYDANGNRCIINNRTIDSVVILSKRINFRRRKDNF